MTKATLPRREEPTHAAPQRVEFRNFTILEHNFLKVEHKLRKGSSLTGKRSISCSQKTLVKSSSQHTAPCLRINCISRVRHSTGPCFLEVKGRGCRRACSPSTLRASVAFPLALISYAKRRGSPAAEIAVLTRSRNFHFSSIPFPLRTLPPESCHVAMIS